MLFAFQAIFLVAFCWYVEKISLPTLLTQYLHFFCYDYVFLTKCNPFFNIQWKMCSFRLKQMHTHSKTKIHNGFHSFHFWLTANFFLLLAIQYDGAPNRLAWIISVIRIVQDDFQLFIFLIDRCGQWKWLQWCGRRWRCNRCRCRNRWLWQIGVWLTICIDRWQIFIRILAHC